MRRVVPILILLVSCNPLEPELDAFSDVPRLVGIEEVWSAPIDALLPTDVIAEGGRFTVLDGYRDALLMHGSDHEPMGRQAGDWGEPVRVARASEGLWLSVPARSELLRIDSDGTTVQTLAIEHGDAPVHPVAVASLGDTLVVGLREGPLLWVDAATGEVRSTVEADVDGVPFGSIADVAVTSIAVLAVDALGPHVHVLSHTGEPLSIIGRQGQWIGTLTKPKAAVAGPDGTVLVGDSGLSALQLFDGDGTPLGMIARDGEPLRIEDPIGLAVVADGRYLVLDQHTATVWGFQIRPSTITTAREVARYRHLRTALVDPSDERLASGELCLDCHDGTVNDERYVWDPDLHHHPVEVAPERELPAFFPLDDEGRLRCTTCHSPHGISEVAEVRAAETEEQVGELVRHQPGDEVFTRMSRKDSALCVGCHEDAAHERLMADLGVTGGHPVGPALRAAMEKRGEQPTTLGLPGATGDSCLTCHAVHGADGESLLRDATSGEVCAACHQEQAGGPHNHPVGAATSPAERSAVAKALAGSGAPLGPQGFDCATCHDLVAGQGKALVRTLASDGRVCTTCHTDQAEHLAHGDVPYGDTGGCLSCHDVHRAPKKDSLLRTLARSGTGDRQGCRSCHGAGGTHAKRGVDPGGAGHPIGVEDVRCTSCHDVHDPGTPLRECGSCHEDEQAAAVRGGHGRTTCADCHAPHSAPQWATGRPHAALNPASVACATCHGPGGSSKRTVQAWEHPVPVFLPDGTRWTPLGKLPLYDDNGDPVPPGDNGDLTCQSCHLLHGPSEAKPGDKLRRPDWQDACSSCHGTDALELYRYFHQPARRTGGR